jgi:diaminopimelate epimerase
MRFEKWQALGNDYVIVEREGLAWELTPERVRRICAPHFGVGSDGVLLLSPAGGNHVAELRIFNPDGSEAELSGNGAREAALYLRRRGWTEEEEFSILTAAGEVRPRILSESSCAMAIGRASTTSSAFPSGGSDGRGELEVGGRRWGFQHVSIGNPQCVIEVGDDVEELDLGAIGPGIERHELFPERTNVSFTRVDGSTVRARVFERGVGETLSSGTGASGAAVAAVLGGAASPITVRLDGGELEVEVSTDLEVVLIGSAEPVYAGELFAEMLARLERQDG